MIKLDIEERYEPLRSKFEYVLAVFHSVYEVPDEISVFYGNSDTGADIRIRPGENVTEFYSSEQAVPREIRWISWEGNTLPILFHTEAPTTIVGDEVPVSIWCDLLSSAFFFLACWQEQYDDSVDRFGRFPAEASLLYQNDLMRIPVVNYYFDMFIEAIALAGYVRPSVSYLGDENFSVSITHDIDQCRTGWREESFRALIDGKIGESLSIIRQKMSGRDVWFNFDEILGLEHSLNITSSFYFLVRNSREKNVPHADYSLDDPEIQQVMQSIIRSGSEIGIHGSYGTGRNASKLQQELSRFPVEVAGGRFHFLALSIPKSWDVLQEVGLQYDSSLGFAESTGFRSGFCFPYRPYNIEHDTVYDFLEFPLCIMDRTFTHYLKVDQDEAVDRILGILDEVKKFNGHITLLWHNKYFSGYKYGGWRGVFEKFVEMCQEQGGIFITPKALAGRLL